MESNNTRPPTNKPPPNTSFSLLDFRPEVRPNPLTALGAFRLKIMESRNSLGRYELTAQIARGGMSDVFEARDRLLDRQVAVKILHERYAEAGTFVARFRKEARAVANLSHPNIVSVYDWGEEDSTYYMVMELIRGRSLRDILDSEGRLQPRRATEIAIEIAKALDAAHHNDVIHRDIKPGNVLLTTDGSVKVTDFGVARARSSTQGLTKAGSVIGTATYFSPEQASGDPADERSDVYSLGVVLYEMLVGRPPFRGESAVSVAYQHVTAEVVPPSRINTDVPLELEDIVMKALEKDPQKRYKNAADMHHDMVVVLHGKPSHQSLSTTGPPTRTIPAQTGSSRPAGAREGATPTKAPSRRPPSQLPFVLTALILAAGVVYGAYLLLNSLSNDPTPSTTVPNVVLEVPDVNGLSEEGALLVLQEEGFRVRLSREASDSPVGLVLRTEPGVGTVTEDAFITMVISSGPAQIQVPNVVGSTEERAISQLEGQGFSVTINTARHDTVGVGLVISQSPSGETQASSGSAIELVISAGPEPIEMPEVIGLSRDRAEGILEGLGLEVSSTQDFDDLVEVGFVVSQVPPAGSDINPGRDVLLVISQGSATYTVEDLSGRPIAEAIDALEQAGMQVQVIRLNSFDFEIGLVISTEPAAGTTTDRGNSVTLFESIGPDVVSVPDLTGFTPANADLLLAESGFQMEVGISRVTVGSPDLVGRIVRQAPGPGEEAMRGDTVLVVLGQAPVSTTSAGVDDPESNGNG